MSDIPFEEGNNVISWRIRQLADTAKDLVSWQRVVDKKLVEHDGELTDLGKGFSTLAAEVRGLRKVIMGFALSIAGSTVVLSLSTLIATGKL